jgi:hypothetical protein
MEEGREMEGGRRGREREKEMLRRAANSNNLCR